MYPRTAQAFAQLSLVRVAPLGGSARKPPLRMSRLRLIFALSHEYGVQENSTPNSNFQVQITPFAIARILLRSRVDLLSQMPLLVASTNGVAHNPTPVTLLGGFNL